MNRLTMALGILFVCGAAADAQVPRLFKMSLNQSTASPLPISNVYNDIVTRHDSVWCGTETGLDLTTDYGFSWRHFANSSPFDSKGISAIAVGNGVAWVATAYTFTAGDQSMPAGGGLYYSTNGGQSWTFVPQPVDSGLVDTVTYGINKIKALSITTTANNITYDIALTRNTVWTANFAGMLRKRNDLDTTWRPVPLPPDGAPSIIRPTDTLDFDLAPTSGNAGLRSNLNHRVFSVYASDDTTIWVGTAGGINKSTDGGVSWQRFSHQDTTGNTISGNFVVAINEMRWKGRRILWAATVNAESSDETRGVSFTSDGGATWQRALLGEFAHNIGFKDSIVYVATDGGLYRSSDFGSSWLRAGTIYDRNNLQRFVSSEIYCVAATGDTIWVGGPEGIAYTIDNVAQPFGSHWKVFRTYQPVASSSETYSFPSPFSPANEPVRIHLRVPGTVGSTQEVSIRVFDFAMQPVRTILQRAARTGGQEYDEIWNGTNDAGDFVANGVYFYRIEFGNDNVAWGKVFVVR